MKKKVLIVISIVVCVLVVGVFLLAGQNIYPHTGYYLKADNGSHIFMLDDSPIVMSLKTGNEKKFEHLESGDKIFVLHDGIEESYPGGTGVYFLIKLGDGDMGNISETALRQLCEMGWLSAESLIISENLYLPILFDISSVMSYSMFDDDKIEQAAINADEMNDDAVAHLPVFKFDTSEEFNEFLSVFDDEFDTGYSDATDFRDGLKGYDDEFFKDKSVIVVFFKTGSSNVLTDIESVFFDGGKFCLNFRNSSLGDGGLAVVSSWMTVVGVEKRFIDDCNYFDAVLS